MNISERQYAGVEIIEISGQNDQERTASLKAQLTARKHCADNYEWHNGEPLYHGEPTYSFFALQKVYFMEV